MHYPFTYGPNKVSYTDFLRDHLKNTENILISQNICGQKFSGIFAPSKLHDPIPETAWVMKSSYDDLQDERCKANKNIYSLACDEVLGFGCYFMSGYGDSQSIVSCDNETITSKIMAKYNEGIVQKQWQLIFIHTILMHLASSMAGFSLYYLLE